jgi:HlyD family secretion protein
MRNRPKPGKGFVMRRSVKWMILALVGVLLIGAAVGWYRHRMGQEGPAFQTAAVVRGDLRITIGATGTVEPEEVVDVGAQVAGQILSFGKDADNKPVDYGSTVAVGTVLARIDDSLYQADLANADAQVQAAQAAGKRAEADLGQYRAKLQQAERDWQRAQKIGPSEALAQTSFDAYRSAYETARANLAVGEAAILQAHAGLAQAQAVLKRASRNLSYCTIVSPVNGVIIDRRVNIGQTVVASLNAPSLFLIAKDLTRMQVWVAVNEADIGRIHPGQPVSFTVDAFPGETFRGSVGKVRLNASMTQNVVTYTVEITTDNSDGRLLPYLTANVQFELKQYQDVLQVPNAALRWQPANDQIAPSAPDTPLPTGQAVDGHARPDDRRRTVWVPEDGHVRPLRVHTGASDGLMTVVEGKGLKAGMMVVIGLQTGEGEAGDARNPFTPQFRRNRSKG